MSLAAGSRLGPYEIAAQIGAGGMGEVYRATDTNLKRGVALKVLPDSVANDAGPPRALPARSRSARLAESSEHRRDLWPQRSTTTSAIVMELVEGPTLAERIEEVTSHKAQGSSHKGLPLDEALAIARQIADALEAAHEQGIIHRDLKPANIKVRDDGTVKVLDFGLAKALGPAEAGHYIQDGRNVRLLPDLTAAPTITSPAMMTGVGMLLGTAAYMSPEQARGKAVDKRTDIWAFGCVLYEMLTGTRAFDGDDVADTLANVLKVDPDWARLTEEVPPPIRALVRNSLEKDRRKRVSDAGAIQFRFGACGNICCPTTHRRAALRRGIEASRAGAVDAPI